MKKYKCKASKEALEKIMRGEVKQRSRWYFFFQNMILWAVGTLSVIAGSLLVSLMIFTVMNCDASVHHEVYGQIVSRVTILLVIVWILLTGGFIMLSDLAIRRTKRGYMYPLHIILIIDIILSIVFGMMFYVFGVGSFVDDALDGHMDHYSGLEKRRADLFHKPEKGLLVGRVVHVDDDFVEIATMSSGLWIVFTNDLNVDASQQLQAGSDVIFAGEKINGEQFFVACDTRIMGLHGVHAKVQQKQLDLMMRSLKEYHENIIQKARSNMPIGNFCDDGVHWRIQLQR